MLDVTVYAAISEEEPYVHTDVHFVSLVSDETYGKPALIAPGKPGEARAAIGERVLYLNTRFIPMWEIVRTSD